MESELKRLPLWLLALIRNLSAKTHQLKKATVQTRVQNTLKSLAEYLSHKPQDTEFNLAELIREFSFLTKISTATTQEDLKSLLRRHLIKLSQKNGRIFCKIIDPELLQIFTDYLQTQESETDFIPYKLNFSQKKILVFLSANEEQSAKTGPEWISFINEKFSDADVSQWINLLKLEWFEKNNLDGDQFFINKGKIRYFLKALRYETNIRGVL
jgi:hypothetical protein